MEKCGKTFYIKLICMKPNTRQQFVLIEKCNVKCMQVSCFCALEQQPYMLNFMTCKPVSNTITIRSFWTGLRKGADPDQIAPERVARSGSVLFAILSEYLDVLSMVKPHCSNFRIIAAIFSGVLLTVKRKLAPVLVTVASIDEELNCSDLV